MVAYVLQDQPARLLDPALGEGVFFRAANALRNRIGLILSFMGETLTLASLLRRANQD